jgi:hypothetical protein
MAQHHEHWAICPACHKPFACTSGSGLSGEVCACGHQFGGREAQARIVVFRGVELRTQEGSGFARCELADLFDPDDIQSGQVPGAGMSQYDSVFKDYAPSAQPRMYRSATETEGFLLLTAASSLKDGALLFDTWQQAFDWFVQSKNGEI